MPCWMLKKVDYKRRKSCDIYTLIIYYANTRIIMEYVLEIDNSRTAILEFFLNWLFFLN
jgi:hypothetical protein